MAKKKSGIVKAAVGIGAVVVAGKVAYGTLKPPLVVKTVK